MPQSMPPFQRVNKLFHHPVLLLAIRISVGGIFLAFGISKVIEPREEFFAVIATYDMLPTSLIPIFGTILLFAEIIAGLLFLFGVYTRWSAYAIAGLLLMFMGAISQTLIRGIPLDDCGCSGSLIRLGETPTEVLLRDAIMLVGVVWFLYAHSDAWTIDRLLRYTTHKTDVV
jgi:uncharacterized membrane protein YphA (DoxX/SURF4 family)